MVFRSISGFKIFLTIVLCWFLWSCTPNILSTGTEVMSSAKLMDSTFMTKDGSKLPVRKWFPEEAIEGVIIGVHGFNDYSNFIRDCIPFFTKQRLAVYTYDQRGFGETDTRGRWSGKKTLADDLTTFVTLVAEAHPDTPLYILGDSMGGAVTISSMVMNSPQEVDGIILVAPAVWARSQMPLYQRFALWLSAYTVPWLKVSGQSLDIVASDNTEMLRELGRDPLVIKESRIETLYGLSNLMDQAYSLAEELQMRTLVLYGMKDEIIPPEPVHSFINRLPNKSDGMQQAVFYENGYHMLLRDLQAEVVLTDIVTWINSPAGSLLSDNKPSLTRK